MAVQDHRYIVVDFLRWPFDEGANLSLTLTTWKVGDDGREERPLEKGYSVPSYRSVVGVSRRGEGGRWGKRKSIGPARLNGKHFRFPTTVRHTLYNILYYVIYGCF